MVVYFLIGCGAVLLVVGCAGVRSGAPEEQDHTEATKEQGRSSEVASEEARCRETQPIDRSEYDKGWLTNDVPGCSNGGLLAGTDERDLLDGKMGDDEIRGLGANDDLIGGLGSDVIYGGPGDDFIRANTYIGIDRDQSKDVLHGGPGRDQIIGEEGDDVLYGGDGDDKVLSGDWGEDVIYGGDGNDWGISGGADRHRDKLYCGEGRDHYIADEIDYVDSSCEAKLRGGGRM